MIKLFRISWELAKQVDGGTVVYSGENRYVAAVYSDPHTNSEYLGNSLWDQRSIEFVHSGRDTADVVDNGNDNTFERYVYLLTKQRCNCQCWKNVANLHMCVYIYIRIYNCCLENFYRHYYQWHITSISVSFTPLTFFLTLRIRAFCPIFFFNLYFKSFFFLTVTGLIG